MGAKTLLAWQGRQEFGGNPDRLINRKKRAEKKRKNPDGSGRNK